MEGVTVFQEQSMLLYVIAGLLVVLIIVGIATWLRVDAAVQALKGQPNKVQQPKPMTLNPYRRPDPHDEARRTSGSATSAYYGGKPPADL